LRRAVVRFLLAFAGGSALASCERAGPTEAGGAAENRPLFASGDAPPVVLGTFTIPVHPAEFGNTGRVDWTGTGIAVEPGAYIRVYIDNGLTLRPNEHFEPLCSNRTCFVREGEFIPPSHPSMGPKITFGSTPTPSPGTSYNQIAVHENPGGWGYFYHNSGTTTKYIYVMRAGLPGAVCYEYKCYPPADCCAAAFTAEYEYAGTQRLRAVQVPNPVRVRALAPRIRPGEAATFTAEIDGILRKPDGTPGGIRWVWAPNDTLAEHQRNLATVSLGTACSGKTTCTYTPLQSGRMVVEADVEGRVVKNVSEVVWRRGCEMFERLPDDSLLSHPAVLNVMEDLAKRSRFGGYVRDRKEYGGYLLEKDGRIEYREWTYGPGMPTTCRSDHLDERARYMREGYTIRGEIHSHPSGSREIIDTRGNVCPHEQQVDDFRLLDGPSGEGKRNRGDLDPWETGAADHVGYIIDPVHIHRWHRTVQDGNASIVKQRWNLNRGSGRCMV
jgi:hypothetical protein